MRSRRCGAPTDDAVMEHQLTLYPIIDRSPTTWSKPRVRWPATFSRTTCRGTSAEIASAKYGQRCRSSTAPCRRPAAENGWQGYPPHSTSIGSTRDQSTAVMSPRFGTPGHLCASTFDAASLNSHCHTVRAPNTASTAMSRPPPPENREPSRPVMPPAIPLRTAVIVGFFRGCFGWWRLFVGGLR